MQQDTNSIKEYNINIWINGFFDSNKDTIPEKYIKSIKYVKLARKNNELEYITALFTNTANYLKDYEILNEIYGKDNIFILDDPNTISLDDTNKEKLALLSQNHINMLQKISNIINNKKIRILSNQDESSQNTTYDNLKKLLKSIKDNFYQVHPVVLSDQLRLLLLFIYPQLIENNNNETLGDYIRITYMDHDLLLGNEGKFNSNKALIDSDSETTIVTCDNGNSGYLSYNPSGAYNKLMLILNDFIYNESNQRNIKVAQILYGVPNKENLKILMQYIEENDYIIAYDIRKNKNLQLETPILESFGPSKYQLHTTRSKIFNDISDTQWVINNKNEIKLPCASDSKQIFKTEVCLKLYRHFLKLIEKNQSKSTNNELIYTKDRKEGFLKEIADQLIQNAKDIKLLPLKNNLTNKSHIDEMNRLTNLNLNIKILDQDDNITSNFSKFLNDIIQLQSDKYYALDNYIENIEKDLELLNIYDIREDEVKNLKYFSNNKDLENVKFIENHENTINKLNLCKTNLKKNMGGKINEISKFYKTCGVDIEKLIFFLIKQGTMSCYLKFYKYNIQNNKETNTKFSFSTKEYIDINTTDSLSEEIDKYFNNNLLLNNEAVKPMLLEIKKIKEIAKDNKIIIDEKKFNKKINLFQTSFHENKKAIELNNKCTIF